MLSSRLRWRALAVLGALLSSIIMIEWPSIGLAMPAALNGTPTKTTMNTYPPPSHITTNFSSDCLDSSNTTTTTTTTTTKTNSRESNSSSTHSTYEYDCDQGSNFNDNINNSISRNCSATSFRPMNVSSSGDAVIDSENRSTNYKKNISNSFSSDCGSSSNSNSREILMKISLSSISSDNSEENLKFSRIKKLNSNSYNKRKRKKSVKEFNHNSHVFHVTAETLRTLKKTTLSHDEMLQDSAFYDVSLVAAAAKTTATTTTISPLVMNDDNSTVIHYLSRTERSIHSSVNQRYQRKLNNSNLDRNERSTNLSHISGPARKIQLYIKNRFIQLLPDGTINGTQDDLSDYTILQRTTVDVGQIKIQGVATCLYLCMDQCGMVYGSKVFTDDCVFNESMEQHHYNTYSSTFNSNSRRILYLALNRHGEPRKLQIPPTRSLGKLATYTKALTETVPQERVEQLIARTFGVNRVKHGLRQLCDAGKPLIELTAKVMKEHPKCNINNTNNSSNSSNSSNNANGHVPVAVSGKLRISSNSTNSSSSNSNNNSSSSSTSSINSNANSKKKKKKRRCRPDEAEGSNCHRPQALKKRPHKGKCPPDDETCHSRKKKKQQQHNRQSTPKQNGGAQGGGNGGPAGGHHRNKKKSNNGQLNSGKKGRNNIGLRTTTAPTIKPTLSTIQTTTTITPTMVHFTSTEPQDNNDSEMDLDDSLTAASMEDDEEDEINSVPSISEQTQLVGGVGDDFLYDNDYDV